MDIIDKIFSFNKPRNSPNPGAGANPNYQVCEDKGYEKRQAALEEHCKKQKAFHVEADKFTKKD